MKCSPNNILFQLVTGTIHIHSILHVFSKIGLATPLCLLVLVRNKIFIFQNLPFFIIKICRSPCVRWTKVWRFYCPSQPKFFYTISFVFFHRFSETEAIAVLAMLVSQYKFTIKEEPQFASETFEERKSRILSPQHYLTLAYVLKKNSFFMSLLIKTGYLLRPICVPLTFTRR